jgi:hypothetical protein
MGARREITAGLYGVTWARHRVTSIMMTRPWNGRLLPLRNSHATADHDQSDDRLRGFGYCFDSDHPGDSDRNRGCLGRGPTDDHVLRALDFPPSNPQKTADHHGAVQPNELPHTAVESNSLHAICNAFPTGTNSRLPTETQALAVLAELEPHGVVAAVRS